jgi:hypothetical protein
MVLARSDSLTRTYRRSEDGDQGQEHEEEHGKEAGSKNAEREAAGQEGQEVAGPAWPATPLADRQ